jgi:hypothetical protein
VLCDILSGTIFTYDLNLEGHGVSAVAADLVCVRNQSNLPRNDFYRAFFRRIAAAAQGCQRQYKAYESFNHINVILL